LYNFFIGLIVSVLVVVLYHFCMKGDKIGYIRTGEVLRSFSGLKLAQKQFESEYKIAKSNADTLLGRVERIKGNALLKQRSPREWTERVAKAESELAVYSKSAESQIQARQQQLSKEAVDKVNLFIEDYGKAHRYKLILGSTESGNILYGDVGDDITKEVLEGLNAKYPQF